MPKRKKHFNNFITTEIPFFRRALLPSYTLIANQDVVDGDVNQLDKETDESHNEKANAGGLGNGGELLSVGLGAFLDQMNRILGELLQGFDQNFVESFLFRHFVCVCE